MFSLKWNIHLPRLKSTLLPFILSASVIESRLSPFVSSLDYKKFPILSLSSFIFSLFLLTSPRSSPVSLDLLEQCPNSSPADAFPLPRWVEDRCVSKSGPFCPCSQPGRFPFHNTMALLTHAQLVTSQIIFCSICCLVSCSLPCLSAINYSCLKVLSCISTYFSSFSPGPYF